MRRLLVLMLFVALGALVMLAGRASVRADAGGIAAKPVNGKAVGHGLRLWVHVFYAKGGTPGPPPGHGGGGGGGSCADDNLQKGYAAPFANSGSLDFKANASTFPSYLNASAVLNALSSSAQTWNQAAKPNLLSVASGSSATGPSQDGVSELGWVRIVPKNVLAATWSWENSSNQIVEADLFFNTSWSWADLSQCSTSTSDFDIADIATHEMGHALGLSHYKDSGAQATMYPSAPAGETRKTTLTQGDIAALGVALGL
jgi:hypothetical protein